MKTEIVGPLHKSWPWKEIFLQLVQLPLAYTSIVVILLPSLIKAHHLTLESS